MEEKMSRDFTCFIGMLVILIGIQFFMTEKVFLTSQCTRALAERSDPSITRKTWLYEAIFGEPAKIPEKEIAVPEWAGYVILFGGGMVLFQGVNKK